MVHRALCLMFSFHLIILARSLFFFFFNSLGGVFVVSICLPLQLPPLERRCYVVLNPPPLKSRHVLLFYGVLLFFAGFYFYHPFFC